MNPRPASNFVQIALRLPSPWLEEADNLIESLATPGRTPSRTDVLREAIAAGLKSLHAPSVQKIEREPAFQQRAWEHLVAETRLLVQASNLKQLKAKPLRKDRVVVLTDGKRTRSVETVQAAWAAVHDWPGTQFPEYLWQADRSNESLSLEQYIANRATKSK